MNCSRRRALVGLFSVVAGGVIGLPVLATTRPVQLLPWPDGNDPLAGHVRKGQWTLVMYWSVTCTICAHEAPLMSQLHEEPASKSPVNVIGVCIDGPAMKSAAAEWMREHEMRFPSLLGDLREVAAYFSVAAKEQFLGTPTFMIFDRARQLVGVNAGPVRIQAVRSFIARKDG